MFNRPKLIRYAECTMGIILIAASIDKVLHPRAFAEVIYYYQILPDFLINITAICLPWIEITTGLALITGVAIESAIVLLITLMTIFITAILANLIRGIDITCGCFSTEISSASKAEMIFDIIRDIVFLAVGLLLAKYRITINKATLRKILYKMSATLMIAILVGNLINLLRTEQLKPFGTDCLKQFGLCNSKMEKSDSITPEDALAFFYNKAAIFIDTRPLSDYIMGHIPGAVNINDIESKETYDFLYSIDQNKLIIVYDNGTDGTTTAKLIENLKKIGFRKVVALKKGFSEWVTKGYPIDILGNNIL